MGRPLSPPLDMFSILIQRTRKCYRTKSLIDPREITGTTIVTMHKVSGNTNIGSHAFFDHKYLFVNVSSKQNKIFLCIN